METVVLCGSYALGRAAAHSDVDLCYIGDFSHFQRESHLYHDKEFQLMIAPWSWYRQVVTELERESTNIATITIMLATGKCLMGDTKKWRDLQTLALSSYQQGPNPPSTEDIRKIRVRITDLWEDFCDEVENQERLWLSFEILQKCVEAQFTIRQWWAVKSKYQLEELRVHDVKMANLLENCLESLGSKERLENICSYVLDPVGGWMKEPWKA
ncbi:nucleotidyltransferase domain-containing protein [Lederbergia sp. NSJ-179]|nr:nucleotidyltransferase domain-containing protein [Lederbergia sp. NSJ-179]